MAMVEREQHEVGGTNHRSGAEQCEVEAVAEN
jgi:hypothetical protein